MKKYSLYLFDFDGTLFNTMKALYYVFVEAFKQSGSNIEIKEEDVFELSRCPLEITYPKYGGKKEYYKDYLKRLSLALDETQSIEATEKFAECDEFFSYVKKNNIQIGIVTSNDTNHVNKVLEFMKIDNKIFKVEIGCNHTLKVKPDPWPLILALKHSGYEDKKDEVVYVGDSVNDCLCAKNAGVDAYLIDRDNSIDTEFPKIKSLMDLFKK